MTIFEEYGAFKAFSYDSSAKHMSHMKYQGPVVQS